MANEKTSAAAGRRGSRRSGLIIAAALAVIAVTGVLGIRSYFLPKPLPTAASVPAAAIGGPFALVDQNGAAVTDATFRGRYMLIYFGYTFCPDICPTSLLRNMEALEMLGQRAEAIVPILISVDPERDTPEVLKPYADLFSPRLVALTGTADAVARAAQAYRVYYAKAVPAGGDPEKYLIDHTGFTYLMAPDGSFVQFFRHDLGAEAMAERLRQTVN
jgi:protein SCO1/2